MYISNLQINLLKQQNGSKANDFLNDRNYTSNRLPANVPNKGWNPIQLIRHYWDKTIDPNSADVTAKHTGKEQYD